MIRFATFLTVALICLPSLSGAQTATVLESFDSSTAVDVATGQLTQAGEPPVAQSGSACTLSARGRVQITVPRRTLQNALGQWLLLDTRCAGPGSHPVKLTLTAGESIRSVWGYVAAGADTLALPVNQVMSSKTLEKVSSATVAVQNDGDSPLVIDNLRLQPAAAPPKGVVLLDPGHWAVWPGFTTRDEAVKTDTSKHLTPHTAYWPDPLRGDAVGSATWGSGENISGVWLKCADRAGAHVWAWISHYGKNHHQPAVSAIRLGRRTLWQRRRSTAQLLSTASVFETFDGDWSIDWLLKEFAPARIEELSFPIPMGTTRLDLTNGQLAALIIAPARQRAETARFVEALEKDLDRYCRQFVLRERVPPVTTKETDPGDAALTVLSLDDLKLETPMDLTETPPLTELAIDMAPNRRHTAPIVLLPGSAAGSPTVRLDRLRDDKGATLARTTVSVEWLDDVTALVARRPVQRPWCRASITPRLKAGQPLFGILNVKCDRFARPGTYTGNVVFLVGKAEHSITLTLRVRAGLPDCPPDWTFGTTDARALTSAYGTATFAMNASQKTRTRKKIWQACVDHGLNALIIRGASYGWRDKLLDANPVAALQGVPGPLMTGRNLAMVWEAVKYTRETKRLKPGTKEYVRYLTEAPGRTLALTRQARLATTLACLGYARTGEELKGYLPVAESMRGKGIRPTVQLSTVAWRELDPGSRNGCLRQLETLMVDPTDADAATLLSELSTVAPGRVLLLLQRGDRYTAGFYAWATGAAGAYVVNLFEARPAHNAIHFQAKPLLHATARGGFEPTLNFYSLRQGIDDYQLLRACSQAAAKAKAKSVDDKGVGAKLAEIRQAILAAATPEYSRSRPTGDEPTTRQMDQWRKELIPLAGHLAAALKGK